MKLLERIRQYPEGTRKIILWAGLALIALTLIIWWMGGIGERFENIEIKI